MDEKISMIKFHTYLKIHMIYLSRFCMIIMTVMFCHIRIFHIRIKGKKSNTTDLVSMCDGHDGDGILNTPSVGSNAPRDIAAVWKKIISTMSTIIL